MSGKKNILWEPQPKQTKALQCPADELFYGGAKGGGKSDFLLADYLRNINYGEHHRGIIFRRTLPELNELLIRSRQIYTRLDAEFFETKKLWVFPGGATLRFAYLDRDPDVHHYQGHQYTWIGFDELTNWPTDYVYTYMLSCARSAEGVPVSVRASGNPGNVGHQWVKRRFVDIAPPEEIYYDNHTGLTRCYIPAKLEDNLKLQKNDPDYEKRLKALPEHLYRAYRDGDWSIFVGQVFEEFRYEDHVIKPFALDPGWTRFCSIDWGYAKPFSIGWWCVTGDGRMIRYREWYGCEEDKLDVGLRMDPREVAEKSWKLSISEGCKDMVADPACWISQGHRSQAGEELTIAGYFQDAGWTMHKAINNRVSGLARMHELLKTRSYDNRPMMMVFDTCRDWVRLIPQMVADEKNAEDVDTTQEDHIYDETRYAAMSPMSQKVRKPEAPKRIEFENVPESIEYDVYDWL